jgi:hypothetical protein
MSTTLPCTVNLNKYADLLVLERNIRELLRCQNPVCTFLQSAEYKRIKFAITRALSSAVQEKFEEEVIHIPHSQLVMYVSNDFRTVLIQGKVYLSPNPEYDEEGAETSGNKRKRGAASAKKMKLAAKKSLTPKEDGT